MRLLKIILILGSGVPHEKQKGIFNILVKERSFEFDNTKHKIDINNWVYKFSGSENRPIDFKNYQLQWKVFKDLRDGEKEILKIISGSNQILAR